MPRKTEPRIVDPARHPRRYVCLTVAAEYLGLDERTVRARIEVGEISAKVSGKRYSIPFADLRAYKAEQDAE